MTLTMEQQIALYMNTIGLKSVLAAINDKVPLTTITRTLAELEASGQNAKSITIPELKAIAKALIDCGRSSEYTRGICELIADLDAKEDIYADQRAREIAADLGVTKLW